MAEFAIRMADERGKVLEKAEPDTPLRKFATATSSLATWFTG